MLTKMKDIIKKLMKISETKFVWIIFSVWLTSNILVFLFVKNNFYVIISTYIWLSILATISLIKNILYGKKSKNKS